MKTLEMNKLFLLIASLLFVLLTNAQSMKEMFVPRWQRTEAYVSELSSLIGDEHLDFKATEEVMPAKEHLVHLFNHMNWVHGMLSGETTAKDYKSIKDLAELKQNQKEVFRRILLWTKSATEAELKETVFFRPAQRDFTKNELLLLLLDHTRDHTGQLVVYLRLNGLEPPKYKGW